MNNVELYDQLFLTRYNQDAIAALAETGRSAEIVWEGEVPTLPIKAAGWEISRPRLEDLPIEAQRRINIIERSGVPIRDILIAHEMPPETSQKALQGPSNSKKGTYHIPKVWKAIAIGVAVLFALAIAVVAIATLAIASIFLMPFLLMGLAVIAAPFIAVYDPVLIVVLDDERQTWLNAGMWYE